MAQYHGGKWRARRSRDGTSMLLGTFKTRAEAEAAEYAFDQTEPSRGHTRTEVYFLAVELIGREAVDRLYAHGLRVKKKDQR